MNPIAELVSAYQAEKIKLPALFEALGELPALSAADHRAGVEWIGREQAAERLDPLIAKALLAKLATLQAGATEQGDVTMVKPTTRHAPAPSPADDEITRVAPPPPPPD
ncbi:MAG: hypothetical protein WBA65_01900, partial [Rhodanobacter sp.]